MVAVGEIAPNFCLPDQHEEMICSRDLFGKYTILFFYPKDNSKGCTLEAQDFTKSLDEFTKSGANVVGISPDSIESHRKFIEKRNLSLQLLSDPNHDVLEKYGVWQLKKMYGKEYYGVMRSTFLIDPKGTIAYAWEKVKVSGHVDSVLAKLAELSK